MPHPFRPLAPALLALFAITSNAAIVKINGASFDAPETCQAAADAIVCTIDGQQLELSVHRQPFAAGSDAADSLVKRGAAMQELHAGVVASLMKGTSSLYSTAFDTYGKNSALGTVMAGRGEVSAPSARVATLYSNGELWQILEVVAKRTPTIEALSEALAKSLTLPPATVAPASPPAVVASTAPPASPIANSPKPVPAPAPVAVAAPSTQPTEAAPVEPIQTFQNAMLSFQYLSDMALTTEGDGKQSTLITLKHKTRIGRPGLVIALRETKDSTDTAEAAISAQRAAALASMGSPRVLAINKLGALDGTGFAAIGTPSARRGGSGIESFESNFATVINGKLLTVTLTSEQKYSEDMEFVWSLLARSLVVK
ncbi:MAG: hypothetical protein EAZ30_15935 [Betaproteobacteria bacterium]|nr:MAG: hypothetical protein EAZ30_15935 [Betaproteobacteria bacterium]